MADNGIWIGTRPTTDEERAEIERGWHSNQPTTQGGTEQLNPATDGYFSGPMAAPVEQQPIMEAPVEEPKPSTHYLANPQNFAEEWTKFDRDPNYQDDHYSREQIDGLYEHYSLLNPGKTMDQWGPLMDDDEFVTKEIERNNWYDPVREEQIRQAAENPGNPVGYNPDDPAKQAMMEQKELGDWENLDWIGKLSAALTVTDQGLGNQPSWVNKSQATAKALSSAMAGPATLKMLGGLVSMFGGGAAAAVMTNPYVLAGAALVTGGLTFYSAVTKKEIPVFQKFLELSDLADTITEHAIGFGAQTMDVARQNLQYARQDPNDAYGLMGAIQDTIQYVGQHAQSMWDTGEYTYEMFGSVGDFAIDALKEIFKGEEGTKQGEAWFFNRGINEKQQLAEGTYGAEGMRNLREIDEDLIAMGIEKDLRDSLIQQWVINASGSSGNVSDYVAQSMIDLGILTTPFENEAAGIVSRITGDQRGIEATQINRGNIATQLPFVGNIIQAVQNSKGAEAIKAPGGIMEWMDVRRNLARTTDVSQLTAADRFFGGINADGTLKEFARTDHTGPADLLPESKVAGVGNIANNVMNAYMSDVKDTADIRNRLAAMAGEANDGNNYGVENTADVITVRDGLKAAIAETNPEILIRQFESSAPARDTLTKTAAALGMEVRDVLSLYSETPAVFDQRVRDYAAQHNGQIAGIDVNQGTDQLNTIIQGFTTAKEGKGAPMAWDIRQLQFQITTSLIDSMAKYYTEYYGVKPGSVTNTIFDTMKSAQSLLLLGWSPSYFINNVVNNAVTSAAEGVLGFMTTKQISQFMDAFGVTPARFDVDTNAEFRGQTVTGKGGLEAFTSAVSEAKKKGTDKGTQRLLRELNGVLRQTNDKLGIFSRLSGKMETLQGNQLTTVAIQQYWRQRWKRGEGFHLMPDALVQTIEAQTPGMTDVIYTAIENGLNMDQIGKVLYGTYIKPDAGTVMKTVCQNLFRDEANVFEEVLEKSGVMNELNERIANCTTDAERQTVIDDVREKVERYQENLRREDLIERANNTAAVVEAEGLAPVAQMMSEMEMNHVSFWTRIREEWSEYYRKNYEEKWDTPTRQSYLAEMIKRQRKEWADLYKQEVSTAAGIMQGLGFKNESHVRFIGLMNENNKNWVDFNDAKSQELARAYERTAALDASAEEGKKVSRKQKDEIWDEFRRRSSELYDQHFAKEQEIQEKMDAAFVEGYEFSTQKSGEQLRQNFQRVREIRQRMHDMQQKAHNDTAKMNAKDKNEYYARFNPEYNALIREIGNLGDANARIVEEAGTNGPGYEDHTEPTSMTPEQTIAAEHTMQVNKAQREQAMRERAGYLDREGIRQGWIEAGRTPAEADLMMAIYDAAAETWAFDNGAYPDEFYTQAVQLKGIATWLPGTDRKAILQTANGESVKVDTIRPADINTDNFRAWFGNSKVVDENGNPMVVYHGTAEQFDTFKKQKANDKLGRSMGLGLGKNKFYLTTERAAGEAFANSAVSMGRGKSPQVMELYLSMQKPMTQAEYESRLAEKYSQYEHSNPRQEGYDYRQRDKAIAALDKEIRAEGYDGIWDQESGQIAVFEPTQIKSIYNGGEWSRVNPNVLNQTVEQFVSENYEQLEELHNQVIEMSKDPAKQITIEGLDDADWQAMAGDGTIQLYDVDVVKIFLKGGDEAEEHKSEANDIVLKALYDKLANGEIDGFEITTLDGNLTYYFTRGFYGGEVRKTSWDAKGPISHSEYNSFKDFRRDGNSLNGEQIRYYTDVSLFQKVADPESLYQDAREIAKGSLEHTDIGNIIRMLEASDVSTMAHESGHLFRWTLSQPLLQEFTTWAGFESVGEFQELEAKFWANDPDLSDADRARYEDAEEKFARGFEQYLMDGSAPTPGLKAVFKQFQMYLFSIYQKVKAAVTGNDYSGQGEFVFNGEVLNINAEINGVKLRDIFDRMLAENPERAQCYFELIQQHLTELSQDRHNMRQSAKALSRRAQVEVNHRILKHWNSLKEAIDALAAYDLPLDIDGMKVDDATLWQAIHEAQQDSMMNPFSNTEHHTVTGGLSYAHSILHANENQRYQMRYKIVELDDLQPSNVWFGDQLIVNENYPADVQNRNRVEDVNDVYNHALHLNPGLMIDEMRAIDAGTPIIGNGDMFVESGNGRVLSMIRARDLHPDQWAGYQEYLRNSVSEYGIDPDQLDSFENPVLVRERMDGGDRVAFAEDANSKRGKDMTASENALTDANKMDPLILAQIDIVPGEDSDTFQMEKNMNVAFQWVRSLPEMEQAKYTAVNKRTGATELSMEGQTRFLNAIFATLYATPESMPIIRSFSETADSSIQAVESALRATLPEMARAEGLIRSGQRAADLSITADIMVAAGLLNEAREAKMNIHDFLAQAAFPGMERWTPTQALLAGYFGDARNNVRMIKDFLNAYGEEVYKSGDPSQLSMFDVSKSREQMIDDALKAAAEQKEARSKKGPALNQSVMDSDGKWTAEFAKVLDENLQRTFDDGRNIPLDQADSVYLKGEVNTKYETMVQRWLRDFSNGRNLTADQYLYAWGYLEWWVHGENGEAPKGNPVWEKKVQQMVMQDFNTEHGDLVAELKRRYRKGAEVEPGSVPEKGEFFKKVYAFEHGYWNIAGNVYKDGKIVAYLPEELSKMQRTIEVDGETFKVLGIDTQNPDGLVYYDPLLDMTRTVIAGKPEGFDEPRNPFSFFGPAHQGSTPQTMPVAEAYGEIKTKYLDPALEAFGEAYKQADTDAKTKKMSGLDLQTRAQIEQWLDQDVANDMRSEKYRAVKYSDMKKDAAMLNYNQRYGFDPMLTMLSPYQFWYTRSMWKWAKRMIDKPSLGNAYERMQEYEDKNRVENLPSRLSGKWRIPMPYLPDWMGGSYYIDLNSQLFPFSQFGESYSSNMNTATLNARTESILNEQMEEGHISNADMQQALKDKKGLVWENAYAQAELEVGKDDQLNTLMSQFFSPNIFFSWYNAKQNNEDPGTLSGTRTGNAVKTLTSDIPLVSKIGSVVGDAMTLPERALRKLYGFEYNEFGQYGDQQIRKQISQMVADGEIDRWKGMAAMNEKKGLIWDMAADRQKKEAMMKVPAFQGAQAAKEMVNGNASVGDAVGSMVISLLGGGSILPSGEKTLREQKASYDQACLMAAAGDTEALSRWHDENPDYITRIATYMDDPEELLKYTLYQNISANYYAQPYAQQMQIQEDLEPEFKYALLNKETRNYKAVPIEKLAQWNAALGGTNPDVGSIDLQGVQQQVMQLSQPVVDVVTEHDTLKNQLFPGIGIVQDQYYALPKDQRKAFLDQVPRLPQYWDWNRGFKNDHPEYVRWDTERSAYYNEETCYNSYAEMSQRTQQELAYAKATGNPMSDAATYELQRLYRKNANENFLSFDDYVKLLQDWE